MSGKSQSGAGNNPLTALFDEQKRLKDEMRPYQEERRLLFEQMEKCKEQLKKKTGEAKELKNKLPFRSIPDMEARVAELEREIESGQLTIKEEKNLLGEISKLKKARRAFESADNSGNDVETIRLRIAQIRAKITESDGALSVLRAKAAEVASKINEHNRANAQTQAKIQDKNAAIEKSKKEINQIYSERREAYEEYRQAKASQYEAKLKRDARRAEFGRRRELEDKIEELEEKLLAFNPETANDLKISECNNIKAFFQGSSEAAEGSEAAVKKVESAIRKVHLGEDLADAIPIAKKSSRDEYVLPPKGKKHGKPASSHAPPSEYAQISFSKLPFHILSAIADLDLPIPTSPADVPSLLSAIEKKKTSFSAIVDKAAAEKEKQRQSLIDEIDKLKKQLDEKSEPPSSEQAEN